MPKYRIITSEEAEKVVKKPIVELRLVLKDDLAVIEGRNPDKVWKSILFFNTEGMVGLQMIDIIGLETCSSGYIKTY